MEALRRWGAGAEGPDAPAIAAHLRRVREADRRQVSSKQRFVAANLRLVVMVAHRYQHHQLSLGDMIQEGNLGLMTAVERYDAERGFRFSTYAIWWIRHGIQRAIANKASVVRVPVHRLDARRRLARASRKALALTGAVPTAQRLAEETGIARKKVEELQNCPTVRTSSLDRPVGDAEGRTFGDCLADESGASPDEAVLRHDEQREVQRLLSELKPMEASVLRGRYGFDGEELTLQGLGAQFNLSREHIRQIQHGALSRLRRSLQA